MNANANPQQQPGAGSQPLIAPPLPLEVWGATDKGREREGNEDAIYPHSGSSTDFVPKPGRVALRGRIFVVADGVGGGRAGPEASRWVVRVAVDRYYDLSGTDLGTDLRTAIEAANASLYQYLQSTNAGTAGSTMAAAVIHGDVLHIANVGDSRVYLLRGGKAYRQTNDHTLTERKVAQGLITAEQALTDSDRNVLTRSMGARPTVAVDLFAPQNLQPGDIVLLCSDGLVDMLSDEEIVRLVGGRTPKSAVKRLIAAANRRGGFDNISVIIARFGGAPLAGTAPAAAAGEGGVFARVLSDIKRMSARQKTIVAGGAALVALVFCLVAALTLATLSRPEQPTPTATPTTAVSPATEPAVEETATAAPTTTLAPAGGRPTSTPAPTPTLTPTSRPPTLTPTPLPPPPDTPVPTPDSGGGGGEGGGAQPTSPPPPPTVPPTKPPPPPS